MAEIDAIPDSPHLIWWLQDQERQNFGDYLTAFLWDNLAGGLHIAGDGYRLIGSAISDWIVHDDLAKLDRWENGRIVFWCCGMRDDTPLNVGTRERSVFCGVRGPLTRAALDLPLSTPMGDPGLLLPLLHQPRRSETTRGKTVCAPHFHDAWSDEELRERTGAEVVVRPAIEKSRDALMGILDDIASADFVLAGSLHAAIVACAYRVPFCYYDGGRVDIPFKWRDFSASVNIGTFFVDNVAEGRRVYDCAIAPRVRTPLLYPILAAAPFHVRPARLLQAAAHDARQRRTNHSAYEDAFTNFAVWADAPAAAADAALGK